MFGVSFPELLFIMFAVLLIFGPDKLPEIASKLGRFFGDLNKSTMGIRREFYNAVYHPAKEAERSLKRELSAVKESVDPSKTESSTEEKKVPIESAE